jgi:integrase
MPGGVSSAGIFLGTKTVLTLLKAQNHRGHPEGLGSGAEDEKDCPHHRDTMLIAVNAGVNAKIIQAFLGHKDPRSTARYTHLRTQTLKGMWEMRPPGFCA